MPPLASAASTRHPTPAPQHWVPSIFLGPAPGPQLGNMDLNVPDLGCISNIPDLGCLVSRQGKQGTPHPILQMSSRCPRSVEMRTAGPGTRPCPWGGGILDRLLVLCAGSGSGVLYYCCAEIPRTVAAQEAPVSCLLPLGRGSAHFRRSRGQLPQEGFPTQRKAGGGAYRSSSWSCLWGNRDG